MNPFRKRIISQFRFIRIMLLIFSGASILNCGKNPSPFPPSATGCLRVVSMDTLAVDSAYINLDDTDLGLLENPCRIPGIETGIHKVFSYTTVSAGTVKTVTVQENSLTEAWFWLASIGPYVGNTAPLFTIQDVEGNNLSLEEERGKVVVLIFFEHT